MQFWYATFPQVELRESIPRTRAAWLESVDRLIGRDDTADNISTARNLHESLAKVADFEIQLIDDDTLVIEYSSSLILTMTAEPLAERDQPKMH